MRTIPQGNVAVKIQLELLELIPEPAGEPGGSTGLRLGMG